MGAPFRTCLRNPAFKRTRRPLEEWITCYRRRSQQTGLVNVIKLRTYASSSLINTYTASRAQHNYKSKYQSQQTYQSQVIDESDPRNIKLFNNGHTTIILATATIFWIFAIYFLFSNL